jgi:hypothetical protein
VLLSELMSRSTATSACRRCGVDDGFPLALDPRHGLSFQGSKQINYSRNISAFKVAVLLYLLCWLDGFLRLKHTTVLRLTTRGAVAASPPRFASAGFGASGRRRLGVDQRECGARKDT